ncbi:MAG: hypothetical protein HOE76_02450 [Euryarchaeota archaeon]|jgi:hypothetical protein|nr:hypothetical protein [Euryarchaeota archaeon]MBT4981823.1 hypothetical protein [Euryarchaeota archaeon]
MNASKKIPVAIFLTVLMFSSVATAAVSSWSGPSGLAGTTKTVSDVFEVPGNATVIDAWLHVDESGYLEDGSGVTWSGENVSNNFSAGQFTNTMIGKFDGAMSLTPDSAVSNVETFSSATLQLPSGWSHTGAIWEAVNPTSLGGTVSGSTRTLAHGYVPVTAAGGGVVAATLPGQGLPANTAGALVTPQLTLPSPINDFNLTFSHWHHLDVDDGAWVEYKLDTGAWTYMEPVGGYPSNISTSAPVPTGANSSGFGVFGDGNHSGWISSTFSLDNLTGITNATTLQFRFQVWTDNNSTSRPGWFLDDFSITNVGNSVGLWHHGCYVATGSCFYSNSAQGMMVGDIDLSSTTAGAVIQTRLEFDLEGSSYDNFCIELSTNNGTTWTDISSNGNSGATTSTCRSRIGAIPGSSYTLPNGTQVNDQSGGFFVVDFAIPTAMIGANGTSLIKYYVETDSSVQYGTPNDEREGLTVDWYKVVTSSGTVLDTNLLSNSSSVTHFGNNGAADDWAFIQIGAGGFVLNDGLEDAPALPPGGWSVSNQVGQTGWEFGAVCANYSGGPSSFPSASLGFGTNLCGTYDAGSDNSLISPNYFVPLGASARFVWKHWMCSEDAWDGGALYVSVNGGTWNQAYVNYANGSNWYDGQITNTVAFSGTDVWDGRQYVATSGGWSCTGATIPWLDMAYDVSNLSGNNVSFKFRQMSDTAVQEPGWYVDNIGLEVDWFETEGSWTSPLIPTHDLGQGFVDADIILPNNTWYGINILDSTGQVITGHENMSLPVSLATIDRDANPGVYVEVIMGTEDEYYTPLISELSIGATRYFGDSNGWNIPASLTRLSNGTWENTGSSALVIAGLSGLSSRPISSALVTGNFSQTTSTLTTMGTQGVSTSTVNSILDLGGMKTHISPTVTLAPGGMIDTLAFRGTFAQPAHDAAIDLGDDGTIDWQFPSDPAYGSYGWQTRIDSTSITHSVSITGNDTLSVMIPEGANIHSLLLGITPTGNTEPLSISSGGNSFYQLYNYNWSTTVLSIANPQLVASSTSVDVSGRNWSMIDIDLMSSPTTTYTIGSFAIGYTLMENVSGLGSVVKAYHELNSNNGLEPIVDVPLTWTSVAGGVAIDGGVYHENMITNHPFTVPETWYPNGDLQGFTTSHHHLLGNENIDEIHLIGLDSSGDTLEIILSNIQAGGTFAQISGFGMLALDITSTVTEVGGRLVVDWQFEVDWDWDDSQSMSWTAQGFDENGEGLSPATAQSGGVATQASENDLQVDSWNVMDLFGHDLSDVFSPAYPFWAKAGTQVSVSGTVRFENTLDLRPLVSDFVVAIAIDGNDVVLNSTGAGQWTGLITLPSNTTLTNLTPYVIRAGPATGASGADDTTLTNPVSIRLDNQSPWASNLQINNGQRLLAADGYTWDPSSSLSLQVTVTDSQALGNEVVMHYWREVLDDTNGDGIADYDEYQATSRDLPEGISGERTLTFSGIDVSGLEMNALFSVFFTGTDYAGHSLVYGGTAGIDNDMATLIIAVNAPTTIPATGLSIDSISEQLLAGQMHTLSMEISDENGINSIDVVTVKLLGADEDTIGVMTWEPRNGNMYSNELSQLTLHDVIVTDEGSYSVVEWQFTLDWNFDESLLPEYAMPGIVVFDDDDLNPVALLTNLGEIRWQLDNDLKVIVDDMRDNTPPLSENSSEQIYVQPGDDLTLSGHVVYNKSGVMLSTLPEQGLEVTVSTTYGSEDLSSYAEVTEGGWWTTGMILPSRSLLENILIVDYSITGVQHPGNDVSSAETYVTVDEISPVVQFSTRPMVLDDAELEVQPFAILILDEGGMSGNDLQVHWAFVRNGVIIENGQSNDIIPYISSNADAWSYVGSIDFTEGVNVSLEDGDELIWWVDVTDRAGNSASGTGLSYLDAMNTDFTVLSFDVTITNIEISLADGSTPRGNEIVEGTEIGVVVHVRNLGTKPGTVTVSLMEDLGPERSWLSHSSIELSLSPGQTLESIPLLFETHGSGSQNLHVNITGMDTWVENSMLPHCFGTELRASCDLNVESDMPRVISQDDADSGLGSMTVIISILVVLLGGAALAIAVLLRRNSPDESIFYDDDDEWEDDEEFTEQKVTPILPPMAPKRPNMEAVTKALEIAPEVTPDLEMEPVVEVTPAEDPWADVDHSQIKEVEVDSSDDEVVENPEITEEVVEEETESIDEADFSGMTVAQLKVELRERGLPVKGRKAELLARLQDE